MELADFGKIKTRLLICGTLLVGGTLFAGAIACPPTMAPILASSGAGLAGVAGNLLAEMVGGDLGTLAERLGRNDDLLTHDLTQAVSRAIAVVIQSVAQTNKYPVHKDILTRLAKTAAESEFWAAEVQELQEDDRFSGRSAIAKGKPILSTVWALLTILWSNTQRRLITISSR